MWTNRTDVDDRTRIGVAHLVTILIFKTIASCYGKRVIVFVVAIAAGDSLKIWEIHVRYNNIDYIVDLDIMKRYRAKVF